MTNMANMTPTRTHMPFKGEELKTKGKKYSDPLYKQFRKPLPTKRKITKFNIWEILKDAVGKDLNKFTMPGIIFLNFSLAQ